MIGRVISFAGYINQRRVVSMEGESGIRVAGARED
jgi:hypothetical protein